MTDKEIAAFYGVSPRTVTNYKNGDRGKRRLYAAMRSYAEMPIKDKDITSMSVGELFEAHKAAVSLMYSSIDDVQSIADIIADKIEDHAIKQHLQD